MTADNNYKEILEEVVNKLENIDTVKEVDVLHIKEAVEELGTLMTDSQVKLNFEEIKEKLQSISLQMDNCNESLLKDIYTDINKLKETSSSVNQYIENLQNIQNLALTSAEFEEYQKQQLDLALKTNENIFNELNVIKESSNTTKTNTNIKQIEKNLETLHKNLTGYIEIITSKIDSSPKISEFETVMKDLNDISRKDIKETNSLLKKLQLKFETFKDKEFQTQFSKISEIYDNLTIINAWIEKVGFLNKSIENVYARLGANIDFDDVSEKIDIIYENISALNNWTMKIDTVDESVIEIQSKITALTDLISQSGNISEALNEIKNRFDSTFTGDLDFEDITNKLDIVYENLSSINTWASKVDALDEKFISLENNADNINNKIESVDNKIKDFDEINNNINEIKENVANINNVMDEEMISSKIDIIYENITLLNKWINKIDDISKQSEVLDNKFNEANSNINEKIDKITETLSSASENLDNVSDIKEKLEKISSALNSITHSSTSDNDSYIYSLLDIESDFLKLHKLLDDNTKTTSNDINALKARFEELNDDISSISVRTNKLILSADDANKEFKNYLDDFKETINLLNEQRENFNPELKFNLLGTRLTELVQLMKDNLSSNENLNTAFLYLAEWVDATGKVLNNISSDIEQVKNLSGNQVQSNLEDKLNTIISENHKNAVKFIDNTQNQTLNLIDDNKKEIIRLIDETQNQTTNLIDDNKKEIVSLINASQNQNINSINDNKKELTKLIDETQNETIFVLTEYKKELSNTINEVQNKLSVEINDVQSKLSDEFNEVQNKFSDEFNNVQKNNEKLTDEISEIKSLLTGVIVQLNTALTPDIDSLNERINKLEEENTNRFKELEEKIQKQTEQQAKQINSVETKIEDMTSKFNKLIEVFSEDNKNYEIKDILNYIATQTSSLNEAMQNQQNTNTVIDTVAEKLTSFDENINKIVSYIEEE